MGPGTREKVDKFQDTLERVKMGENTLDNAYPCVYLDAEIAADGDQEVTVKHRCDIAWGRFGEYRKVLTTTKLPLNLKLRLFETLIVSTMIYGSSAWFLTNNIKRKISKMLSQISKRWMIHEVARKPSLDCRTYNDEKMELLGSYPKNERKSSR